MKRILILIACLLITSSCSSSRWVVTDQNSVNLDKEPVILSEEHILLLQDEPSVENPVMSFATYKVVEKEYERRVRVERSVQNYKPQWKFLILGLTGATFAAVAGNTDLILPSLSVGQQIAFNVTAAILAGLSFTNMEPVGEPIHTGESRLQRRSGTEIITDTLRTDSVNEDLNINLEINYEGQNVFSESDIVISDGTFDINLVSFLDYIDDDIDSNSSIEVKLAYNGFQTSQTVPVTDFLAPFVTITRPVAIIRNAPTVSELNVVTEVGNGSSLELIEVYSEDWYRVRFGGSEVFVSQSAGEIEWMSETESGSPDIFEFAEIPFGEIDVENSVPVLRQNNPNDRAVILTNGFTSSSEPRQYLARDHDLFRFYMRYALQMNPDQIHEIQIDSTGNWQDSLSTVSPMDSTGTLIVYLSGSAFIDDSSNIYLDQNNALNHDSQLETTVRELFERINPSSAVLFADLEFGTVNGANNQNNSRNAQTALQKFSNSLLRRIPNSAIIFSNRPGQHSSLFISSGTENKRHHIFNYYLADALKRRNTEISQIVRHLENNVDYTARRLHDRPQEIQAFGNFTIDLSE
ncbi:SH3 domain-containing protein [Rhodohalobacter sp. 614A]|uniref:SH3 domain-containing protein n=1 Tax=Rhodohalobacter sp. 614A TaxID=2908649 RepID=UPI001F2397A2|nr:SH3 domain-containing protein [Rhodohalobacter sp. 614A]